MKWPKGAKVRVLCEHKEAKLKSGDIIKVLDDFDLEKVKVECHCGVRNCWIWVHRNNLSLIYTSFGEIIQAHLRGEEIDKEAFKNALSNLTQ